VKQHYVVKWEIDVFDCDTPESAAEQALKIQRQDDSIATVFKVIDEFNREVTVDLGHHGFLDD